jgi:hypothetical protein
MDHKLNKEKGYVLKINNKGTIHIFVYPYKNNFFLIYRS